MRIRPFAESDADEVVALWTECGLRKLGYEVDPVLALGKRLIPDA